MKYFFLFFTICLLSYHSYGQNVTIIESQSFAEVIVSDTVWEHVVKGMKLNPIIAPQTTLELLSNLDTTDVLIVSSAMITLSESYLQTIKEFVFSGRPVYIQAEYQSFHQGSKTFNYLMEAVGTNFNWGSFITGSLAPMNVLGTLSTTPNSVLSMDYFNAGLTGSGSGVEPFLENNGNYFGFCYQDSNSAYGTIITTSDKDWIMYNTLPALMENILAKLLSNSLVGIKEKDFMDNLQIYPNPTKDKLFLESGSKGEITIFDLKGKLLLKKEIESIKNEINVSNLINGSYLLKFESDKGVKTMQFIKN